MTVFGSKRCRTGRVRHLVASLLLVFVGLDETCGAPLNDGWTADGEPVTLPHCWNVADGADGPTDPKAWGHDSVGGTGYARKRVVYRRELPPATPGRARYVRVHAASIHAVASVDGREVARHAGAFTAFTFAVPADGKILEIAVDNFHDPDVPPVCGDFTMYGGLYRGVDLVEAEPLVREVQTLIRSLDPRPTVAANFRQERPELNAIPDALGFNLYPGWYNGKSSELGARIEACRLANGRTTIAVSEYGGGGSLGQLMPTPGFRPEAGGKFHPVDYQLKHHVASWAAIKSNPCVWGAFIWQMFDCASDSRREGARAGLNDKGLVAFDHTSLKPAYEFYRREWNR